MESTTHAMTIDTVQPGALGAMQQISQQESKAPPAGRTLLGCWTGEFGRLNQFYRLWRLDGGADLSSLARPPVLQDRQEMLLSSRRPTFSPTEGPSLYELRLYQIQHGRLNEFLELMLGIMDTREKWSKAVGVWVPLNGHLNEVIHFWYFRDLAHRAETRAKVAADPAWSAYRDKILPMLASQTSLLLTPAAGSPMR